MADQRDLQSGSGDDPAYSYKPSLMGAAWEFRLRGDTLEWRAGRHQGSAPCGRIARVRLSFRPVTMQTRRFVTEIWLDRGPRLSIASTSWRSMVEQEAQDRAYGAFIRELHRRMTAAEAQASFETGTPAMLYWPGLVVFAGAALTGLGYSLVYPAFGVEALRDVPPQNRGLAMGAYTAFLDLALGIANPVLGAIANARTIRSAFIASALVILMAAVVAVSLMRSGTRRPA